MFNLIKIYSFFTKKQKRFLFIVIFLSMLAMVFEILSISLIIPILSVITSSETSIIPKFFLDFFQYFFNYINIQNLLLASVYILLVIFFIKTFFALFFVWFQQKYIQGLRLYFSNKLFNLYLYQQWDLLAQKNSADLIRNITGETIILAQTVNNYITAITEIILILGFLIFLSITMPIPTLIVIIFIGSTSLLLLSFFRDKNKKWGEARQVIASKLIKHVQQAFGGIRDIKLLNKEDFFIKKFDLDNKENASLGIKLNLLLASPKLILELAAVICLVVSIIYLQYNNYSNADIILSIGLFAAVGFRVMPAAVRLTVIYQKIKNQQPAVDLVLGEFTSLDLKKYAYQNSDFNFKEKISISNVSYSYPKEKKESNDIRSIDLNILVGEKVAIVGKSGHGKSTILDLIVGLVQPNSGTIKVDEVDIGTNLKGWQKNIAYVSQNVFLKDDTIINNIAFGENDNEIDLNKINYAIKKAKLEEFINLLPNGLNTKTGERGVRISGGEKQRIGIARALYRNISLLILDEATNSLDLINEKNFYNDIAQLNITTIIISHDLNSIKSCNKFILIENGEIIKTSDYKSVENYFLQ